MDLNSKGSRGGHAGRGARPNLRTTLLAPTDMSSGSAMQVSRDNCEADETQDEGSEDSSVTVETQNKRARVDAIDDDDQKPAARMGTESSILSLLSHSEPSIRQGALRAHIIQLTRSTKVTMGDVKKSCKTFLPVPMKVVEKQSTEKKSVKGKGKKKNPKKDEIEAIRSDKETYPPDDRGTDSAYAAAIQAVRKKYKEK
jgi:hypothetical protein